MSQVAEMVVAGMVVEIVVVNGLQSSRGSGGMEGGWKAKRNMKNEV